MATTAALDASTSTTSTHPAATRVARVDFGVEDVHVAAPVDVPIDSDVFLAAVSDARRRLPGPVDATLAAFADERLDSVAAILVAGVPLGNLPATPSTPRSGTTPDRLSELWLLAIARALGQPVGYVQEHDGDLVQNLVPVAAHANAQTSTSSAVTLAWHTETAFHPHRPRWLVLLALRGDPHAATLLADVRDIVAALDPTTVAVLRTARFTTGVDASFGDTSWRSRPGAVLTGPDDQPRLWFDADLMRGEDRDAQAALEQLCAVVDQVAVPVHLTAGDCLVIDNTLAAHGRSPFRPRFDGTDRWLQRALVIGDLAASAGDRDGRIITTHFG